MFPLDLESYLVAFANLRKENNQLSFQERDIELIKDISIGVYAKNSYPKKTNKSIGLGEINAPIKINNISKKGIANVGYRPTFNGKKLLLEVNIFGIKKNLYNKNINVVFNKFIRPEKKFNNIIELKNQIKRDIKQAK